MLLVDPKSFKTFIDKNNFGDKYMPKPTELPCIMEFNSCNVLQAKVEVLNYNELLAVVKYNKSITTQLKNKYWIKWSA